MILKDESNDKTEYIKIRESVKSSNKLMRKAIDEVNDSTKPHYYSNEVNMIYRIVFGVDAKGFRKSHGLTQDADILNHLTIDQLQTIDTLQIEDKELILARMEYQERKERLTYIYKYLAYKNMSNDVDFDETEESGN
jgi:hypothetical protein